jgi:predicted outer membrane lipoprotein
MCTVSAVKPCPLRLAPARSLMNHTASCTRKVEAWRTFTTATWCTWLIFSGLSPLHGVLNMLWLELMESKVRGNLHLVNHRMLEAYPGYIWRELHYLQSLLFPTVSKLLKHTEQLSLRCPLLHAFTWPARKNTANQNLLRQSFIAYIFRS